MKLTEISVMESLSTTLNDYIDKIEESSTLIVDTLKPLEPVLELNKYLNTGLQIWGHFQMWRYKAFLRGFARKTCNTLELNSYKQKMSRLSLDKKFMDFLYQTVFDAINAKSNRASTIMGMYVAELIGSSKEITYEVLLVNNALKELNDWDIDNYKEIFLFLDEQKQKGNNFSSISQIYFKETSMPEDEIDLSSTTELAEYKASVDKLISLQILSTSVVRMGDFEPYTVTLTRYSYTLYDLINKYDLEELL